MRQTFLTRVHSKVPVFYLHHRSKEVAVGSRISPSIFRSAVRVQQRLPHHRSSLSVFRTRRSQSLSKLTSDWSELNTNTIDVLMSLTSGPRSLKPCLSSPNSFRLLSSSLSAPCLSSNTRLLSSPNNNNIAIVKCSRTLEQTRPTKQFRSRETVLFKPRKSSLLSAMAITCHHLPRDTLRLVPTKSSLETRQARAVILLLRLVAVGASTLEQNQWQLTSMPKRKDWRLNSMWVSNIKIRSFSVLIGALPETVQAGSCPRLGIARRVIKVINSQDGEASIVDG